MKPRTILIIILAIGIAGGVAWWMRQPSASESASAAAPPIAALTKPNDIVAPSASTTVMETTANNTVTPVATNSRNDTGTNSQGAKAKVALGLHFIVGLGDYADAGLAYLKQQTATNPLLARRVGDINELQMMPPLPIYNLTPERLADIAKGGGLENMEAGPDFYYLVKSSGNPVIGLEVGPPSGNGDFVVTIGVMSGMSSALDQLSNNDEVSAGSYEARILNIPNADVQVIWLKSDAATDADLIYVPGTKIDPEGTLYTAAEYLQTLRPSAK